MLVAGADETGKLGDEADVLGLDPEAMEGVEANDRDEEVVVVVVRGLGPVSLAPKLWTRHAIIYPHALAATVRHEGTTAGAVIIIGCRWGSVLENWGCPAVLDENTVGVSLVW